MSVVIESIRARLEELQRQVEVIDRERTILRRTLAELDGASAPSGEPGPPPSNLAAMPTSMTDRRSPVHTPRPKKRNGPGRPKLTKTDRVLRYIEGNPRAQVAQIVNAVGMTSCAAYSTVSRLVKDERLVKVDLGERQVGYELPQAQA